MKTVRIRMQGTPAERWRVENELALVGRRVGAALSRIGKDSIELHQVSADTVEVIRRIPVGAGKLSIEIEVL